MVSIHKTGSTITLSRGEDPATKLTKGTRYMICDTLSGKRYQSRVVKNWVQCPSQKDEPPGLYYLELLGSFGPGSRSPLLIDVKHTFEPVSK